MKKILPAFVVLAALFVFAGCCHGEKKCGQLHQHTALCTDDACTEEKKDETSGENKTAMDENSKQQDKNKENCSVDKRGIASR